MANRSGSVTTKAPSSVEVSSGSSTPRSRTRCTLAASTAGKEISRADGRPTTMAYTA